MNRFFSLSIFCLITVAAEDFTLPNSKANSLRLWYSTAGSLWNDSLPIGNGRLGGMVRGVATSEIVSMNEESIWSGNGLDRLNPSAYDSYRRIQTMLTGGSISDATLEANLGLSGTPSSMREYMPGGDFQIVFQNQGGSVKNYERWLDLGDGTAGVYYTVGDITYKREYFSSQPADVMAVRLTASSLSSLSFYIKFQRPSNQQNRFADAAYAEDGDTIITTFSSSGLQVVFGARIHIIGGTKRQIGDQIQVFGADEAWIYADLETNVSQSSPISELKRKLTTAISSTYSDIKDEHIKDYQRFFNRTSLSLGNSSTQQRTLSTSERRKALSSGTFDLELVALYFQFGRYLLISSSRPGNFPPNLQGIWNNDFNPAWGSKYTININLQMNYWPAEVTNLQELTEPLWSLLEKMYPSGVKTAQQMYNARGWCSHHNTDIWGDTAPQDIYAASAYWPMAHAWLLSHVFEHYRFTGDEEFLRKYYYLMYEAAQFYEDFLVDYNGWKVTNPSVSPENSYKNGTTSGALTVGSTCDNSILWELFSNVIEATSILNMTDTALISNIKSLKEQLPPLRISKKTGGVMEWIEDFDESEPGHRHLSHLYGLFPSNEISPQNEEIFSAAANTISRRLGNGSGNIGWSRAWIMSLHARLYNGAGAESDLMALLYNLTYDSLFNSGPPAAFQIDGNFGGCAGIAETLLQSQNGVVNILPALMPSSKSGSFSGLVARGGFVVNASWENGLLTNATILSRLGNTLNVTVGTGQSIIMMGSNSTNSSSKWIKMETKAGENYDLRGVLSINNIF